MSPRGQVTASLADASVIPFWLDTSDRPTPRPRLTSDASADLVVVGGGFCGLWTALIAKERDPSTDVLVVDSERIAWAASGRNGGFCSASITHGEPNGRSRFPDSYDELARLGARNLDEIQAAVERYGIDCHFERTGELNVATQPHQVAELAESFGEFLDRDAVQAEVASPTYLAGLWDRDGAAMLDPARLAWGLAAAAESLGVRIAENTPVTDLARDGAGMRLSTPHGNVRAGRVALATNAFRPLLRRLRLYTVPVYDYVLVTEPLSADQLSSIGWRNRQGIGDTANQFHYYRLTADNRILWGGYDAIYYYGRQVRPAYDDRPATFGKLAEHFFTTFPQLRGLRFSHRWGGAIDTCTRFCAFHGTGYDGRVAYSLGFTGLGVGATRFAAEVMLDLLSGEETPLTRLDLVKRRPLPFPPEPLAWIGIQATRHSLAAADRHEGRRNLWLRALDAAGLGFDS
jgi:glycine/D-amino acid oxidase-like deaminating enzyme